MTSKMLEQQLFTFLLLLNFQILIQNGESALIYCSQADATRHVMIVILVYKQRNVKVAGIFSSKELTEHAVNVLRDSNWLRRMELENVKSAQSITNNVLKTMRYVFTTNTQRN